MSRELFRRLPPGSDAAQAEGCTCTSAMRFSRPIVEATCSIHGSADVVLEIAAAHAEFLHKEHERSAP